MRKALGELAQHWRRRTLSSFFSYLRCDDITSRKPNRPVKDARWRCNRTVCQLRSRFGAQAAQHWQQRATAGYAARGI